MKFTPEQINGNGIVIAFRNQSGIARTSTEAEQLINSFKNLKCNDWTHNYLQNLFAGNDVAQLAYTTGCSVNPIRFFAALAPTIEEHNAIYQAKCEEEKKLRLLEAEKRNAKLWASYNEQRRGWYQVEVEVAAREPYYFKKKFLKASGHTIADSMIDAYRKMADVEAKKMCTEKGLIFESCSEWNSGNTIINFVGMKTDEGFSVEAWEAHLK